MPYWLYISICWLTHPFRMLMPNYRHEYFGIRLLFWNNWKCLFVTTQAQHETGNFTSNIYKENHNLFGMKKSSKGEFQKGVNRGHASYKNVYQSIYDYKDLITNRIKGYGVALSDLPDKPLRDADKTEVAEFLGYVNAKYRQLGYYTGTYVAYVDAQIYFSGDFKNTIWRYCLNWVYCICLPVVVWVVGYSINRKQTIAKTIKTKLKLT